jgi:hypothetical protein
MAMGDTTKEAFAEFAAATKILSDRSGEKSATAITGFADALAKFLPAEDIRDEKNKLVRKGTGAKSTRERLERLWADRELLDQYNREVLAKTSSLPERNVAQALVNRESTGGRTYEEIRANLPELQDADKVFERSRKLVLSTVHQRIAAADRADNITIEKLLGSYEGQREAVLAGFSSDTLKGQLEAAGVGFTGRTLAGWDYWQRRMVYKQDPIQAYHEVAENYVQRLTKTGLYDTGLDRPAPAPERGGIIQKDLSSKIHDARETLRMIDKNEQEAKLRAGKERSALPLAPQPAPNEGASFTPTIPFGRFAVPAGYVLGAIEGPPKKPTPKEAPVVDWRADERGPAAGIAEGVEGARVTVDQDRLAGRPPVPPDRRTAGDVPAGYVLGAGPCGPPPGAIPRRTAGDVPAGYVLGAGPSGPPPGAIPRRTAGDVPAGYVLGAGPSGPPPGAIPRRTPVAEWQAEWQADEDRRLDEQRAKVAALEGRYAETFEGRTRGPGPLGRFNYWFGKRTPLESELNEERDHLGRMERGRGAGPLPDYALNPALQRRPEPAADVRAFSGDELTELIAEIRNLGSKTDRQTAVLERAIAVPSSAALQAALTAGIQ